MTVDNFGSTRDDGGRMHMVVPSLDRRGLRAAMRISVCIV